MRGERGKGWKMGGGNRVRMLFFQTDRKKRCDGGGGCGWLRLTRRSSVRSLYAVAAKMPVCTTTYTPVVAGLFLCESIVMCGCGLQSRKNKL